MHRTLHLTAHKCGRWIAIYRAATALRQCWRKCAGAVGRECLDSAIHGCVRHGALALLVGAISLSPVSVQAKTDLTRYGDIARYTIPLVAASISAAKSDGDGIVQLGATAVVTMGTTEFLKRSIDSERPNHKGRQSFPSGHTAGAFLGASYLHYRYGWQYGAPAYIAAALTGYSRVEANKHRWIDVIGAAAIANATAYVFTDTLNENVQIVPFADWSKHNFGIMARFRF